MRPVPEPKRTRAGLRAAAAGALIAALLAGTADVQAEKARRGSARAKAERHEPKLSVAKGPLHIVVSIADQSVALYGDGALVARAPVSTGTATHPTPTGVFSVLQKNRHHRSNIYSNAPMPFMQRLTWSGIALHQGALPGYPASHGCIRLPAAFARSLFGVTRLGARVIVARDAVAPVAIAHPLLFAPRRDEPPVALRGSIVDWVKTADAGGPATDASAAAVRSDPLAATIFHTAIPAIDLGGAAEIPAVNEPVRARAASLMLKEAERRSGPVSVFVSRREGRLYVRQNFEPLFDVGVTIDEPDQPLGTHVFTAMDSQDGAVRWTVVSMPSEHPRRDERAGRRGAKTVKTPAARVPPAASALERIDIPAAVSERIAALVTPGFSYIVSDHGLGTETGLGTDFIVLTR